MAKKDFTTNVTPVYSAIAEATASETQEIAEKNHVKRERKTYTDAEMQEFLSTLKTAGRKGVKLPRINMAFTPELYDYVRTMSRVSGITLTEFVNRVMKQYMEEHREDYDRAIEFRNSL